jgi:putative Mg2+ transporter-C (MgtC) family protein
MVENLTGIEDSFTKIALAISIGALIGAEREYKSKTAGFRTMILVTLGSTLFTIISELLTSGKDYHVIGNIVVGIGFLGAGAIFKEGNTISGLTTAVTIWVSAALGMAIGTGLYLLAVFTAFVVVLILFGFSSIQLFIDKKNQEKYYVISIKNDHESRTHINELVRISHLRAKYISTSGKNKELTFTIKIKGSDKSHTDFIQLLSNSDQIISFSS